MRYKSYSSSHNSKHDKSMIQYNTVYPSKYTGNLILTSHIRATTIVTAFQLTAVKQSHSVTQVTLARHDDNQAC